MTTIRTVDAIGLVGATPDGGWSNELEADICVHALVAITTDDGLTGWGSVFTSGDLVRASLEVLRPLLIGQSAIEPERVSETLHQHTFWQGRGGAITHTISGIDTALWDILGQVTGQPVGRLLGGRYRERVQPYASILMDESGRLVEVLHEVTAHGFRAIKMGWGPFGRVDAATDEAIVKAAREAVGPEIQLMVDAGASDAFWPNGLRWARWTAEMLAGYDIAWFEEPLPPDALEDFIVLRRDAPLPITGGETLTRRQSFRPWLEQGAFDIVQPDVTKVGGISEERRITWMANDHGVRMIPHGWNTALGLAADLQLASAFPTTDLVEYLVGSPYIDEFVVGGWAFDADGYLAIPATPGLGITINLDAVARYADDREVLRRIPSS